MKVIKEGEHYFLVAQKGKSNGQEQYKTIFIPRYKSANTIYLTLGANQFSVPFELRNKRVRLRIEVVDSLKVKE